MHFVDYFIFGLYMLGVLAIGFYHFFRNKNNEDYYVGNRSMSASHVGLSIVATDVGGGFSIGLGGVGFLMGLSGSWLLFTGLIGAWFSAVFIIPKIKKIDTKHGMFTYPDFLRHRYGPMVALFAALISGIGYLGFTGAQILAGAKLSAGTMFTEPPFGMDPVKFSLLVIAVITIGYTVVGGLKAVIYTDTIQWIILLSGLIFVTVPVTLVKIGGFEALKTLPDGFFSLTNIKPITFVNWMITIVPIWLIGMTLYQRMYACKSEKEAKRAWYIAGIFEYPIMAFTGVFLGMCARVLFPEADAEMAMPMLIRDVLPIGITGIVIAAYFSAIMSTADSCLMASSGNFVNDIIERYIKKGLTDKSSMRLSMMVTLIIGSLALMMAFSFNNVLDAILYAYSFMVAGLFVPTVGAFFWKRGSSGGALAAMLLGGGLTLGLLVGVLELPERLAAIGLDASAYGIAVSLIAYIIGSMIWPMKFEDFDIESEKDYMENFAGATIQHGKLSDRIYLMKFGKADGANLREKLDELAVEKGYSKIFAKLPSSAACEFLNDGYDEEARIPNFYDGSEAAVFAGKYFDENRGVIVEKDKVAGNIKIAKSKANDGKIKPLGEEFEIRVCGKDDADQMSEVYKEVFESYPFPIHNPDYLCETMDSHVKYFGIFRGDQIVALSSAEMDVKGSNVEMTDFATPPDWRGYGFAQHLLIAMEEQMKADGIKTAYTIARSKSPGMNITFARGGYEFGGTLVNNTNISGSIESMNVWYKDLRD